MPSWEEKPILCLGKYPWRHIREKPEAKLAPRVLNGHGWDMGPPGATQLDCPVSALFSGFWLEQGWGRPGTFYLSQEAPDFFPPTGTPFSKGHQTWSTCTIVRLRSERHLTFIPVQDRFAAPPFTLAPTHSHSGTRTPLYLPSHL